MKRLSDYRPGKMVWVASIVKVRGPAIPAPIEVAVTLSGDVVEIPPHRMGYGPDVYECDLDSMIIESVNTVDGRTTLQCSLPFTRPAVYRTVPIEAAWFTPAAAKKKHYRNRRHAQVANEIKSDLNFADAFERGLI